MSATDELRRLLDERGVEWTNDSNAQVWRTAWFGQDGKQWRMLENRSGMITELRSWRATPKQAIAASLGSGTCKNRDADIYPGGMVFVCSACEGMSTDGQPNYCPNCGRKVGEE